MQKEPNIAWRQSQRNRLSRSVSKFNAKLTRELKKNPELIEFLPARLNVQELRASIKTAKDLNNLVKTIDRAFKEDAFVPVQTEKGVKTTKYEIRETKLKVNKINRSRAKEKEKANPSTEKGTMGLLKTANLVPKKFDLEKMSQKEWEKFKAGVDKQILANSSFERKQRYRDNYLKAIEEVFGTDNELYERILNADIDSLLEAYYNDPILQLEFVYDPLQMSVIYQAILEHLDMAEL